MELRKSNTQRQPLTLTYAERKVQEASDREWVTKALEHHLLDPHCSTCRRDFDEALVEWREKYA